MERAILNNKTGRTEYITNSEDIILINNIDELNEIVSKMLRDYILDFKYERLNICFFKRNYAKCTNKQVQYLISLLKNLEYNLSSKQLNVIKMLSMNEISKLITVFKNISYEYIETMDTINVKEVEGSIYRNLELNRA